jgi:aspartate aminotransferase
MSETLKTAEIAQLVKETGPAPEKRLGTMARGLVGSEILRIANEIRALVAKGASVCDLTVGDFSPQQFPIPAVMSKALSAAIERGQTNYPPTSGLSELRVAVQGWYARELGLDYPLESILITSGSRPGIYGTFRTVCDPGDRVVYSIPSWNNNHYTHLVGGVGATIATGPAGRFLPSREAVRAALPGTRLLCLCTPLNPTGTMIAKDVLLGICLAVRQAQHTQQCCRRAVERRRTAGA